MDVCKKNSCQRCRIGKYELEGFAVEPTIENKVRVIEKYKCKICGDIREIVIYEE